jgi:hypothetical protein
LQTVFYFDMHFHRWCLLYDARRTMKPVSVRTGEGTVRETQIWQHQAGSGARKDDMDNICELLINVVSANKPKMLTKTSGHRKPCTGGGLNQKVRWYGQSGRVSLCAIYDSPGGQVDPKSSWLY